MVDARGVRLLLNEHSAGYNTPQTAKRFNLEDFYSNFKCVVTEENKEEYRLEFDLIRLDPSIANAIRRILIGEFPSVAIEKVFMYNNTSVLQDEVLAHRMGLLPIRLDGRLLDFKKPDDNVNSTNTLEFELKVVCSKNRRAGEDETDPNVKYVNSNVLSSQLKWLPMPDQVETFGTVEAAFPDILIAKLRPGHEIDIKCHAVKGIGRDHAKFSPVATAFYRMLPDIKLLKSFKGEEATQLQKCFSEGVIGIKKKKSGEREAFVAKARNDQCAMEVYRHENLKNHVQLSKIRDHILFTVESVGVVPPDELVRGALTILENTCSELIDYIDAQF